MNPLAFIAELVGAAATYDHKDLSCFDIGVKLPVYRMFNQIRYSIIPPKEPDFIREDITKFLERTGVKIVSNCLVTQCFYSKDFNSKTGAIVLPYPHLFQGPQAQRNYYYAVFHELTHWTEQFLKRDNRNNKHGSFEYNCEEIIATFGSAFLLEKFGLMDDATFNRCAGYLHLHMVLIVQYLTSVGMEYGEDQERFLKNLWISLAFSADTAVRFLEKTDMTKPFLERLMQKIF